MQCKHVNDIYPDEVKRSIWKAKNSGVIDCTQTLKTKMHKKKTNRSKVGLSVKCGVYVEYKLQTV